jgi:hypothetical protein
MEPILKLESQMEIGLTSLENRMTLLYEMLIRDRETSKKKKARVAELHHPQQTTTTRKRTDSRKKKLMSNQ